MSMLNLKEKTLLSNMSIIPIIVVIIFSCIITIILYSDHKKHIEYVSQSIQEDYQYFNTILIKEKIEPISQNEIQKHIDTKIQDLTIEYKTYLMQFLYIVIAVNVILIIMLIPLSSRIKKIFFIYKQKLQQLENENKQKNMTIFQQSKMTVIDLLLNMITSQWKEPLSKINVAALNIYLEQKEGLVEEATLKKNIVDIENTTAYLIKTIDHFRDFFLQESKERVLFLNDSLKNCISIIRPSLNNINLQLDLQSKQYISGHIVLFQQIILSLLSYSIKVLRSDDVVDPEISISTYDEKNFIFIEISDNGGGIPKENFTKLFKSYFSSKEKMIDEKSDLYIVKEIVEKNFNGKIKVTNLSDGVKFTVRIKCFDSK